MCPRTCSEKQKSHQYHQVQHRKGSCCQSHLGNAEHYRIKWISSLWNFSEPFNTAAQYSSEMYIVLISAWILLFFTEHFLGPISGICAAKSRLLGQWRVDSFHWSLYKSPKRKMDQAQEQTYSEKHMKNVSLVINTSAKT